VWFVQIEGEQLENPGAANVVLAYDYSVGGLPELDACICMNTVAKT
jgi:hypothetical protein